MCVLPLLASLSLGGGGDWTNISGVNNFWDNTNNWTLGVPSSTDPVTFGSGANYSVYFGHGDAAAGRITALAGNTTLDLAGHTLTMTGTADRFQIAPSSTQRAGVFVQNGLALINGTRLSVAENGIGTLVLSAAGTVRLTSPAANVIVGGGGSGGGTANLFVDGVGSLLDLSGELAVGGNASGHVMITNGGRINSGYVDSGSTTASLSVISVDGIGSTWNVIGNWYLGGSDTQGGGTGTLSISGGGTVAVTDKMKV